MEGVQFSCLRVGNIETHSVQKGTETSVELIYEIPEKLADILKLLKENAVDMSKQGEHIPATIPVCCIIPDSRFQMHWKLF